MRRTLLGGCAALALMTGLSAVSLVGPAAATAGPSSYPEVVADVVPGELLPPVPQPVFSGFRFEPGSTRGQSSYVAFRAPWLNHAYLDAPISILDTATGDVVREVASIQPVRLVGESYVVIESGHYVVRSIATGAETARFAPPAFPESKIAFGETWALVRALVSEEVFRLDVRRADGSRTTITSADTLPPGGFWTAAQVVGDDVVARNDTMVWTGSEYTAVPSYWRIDVATATAHALTPPTPGGWSLRASADRYFWLRHGDTLSVHWAGRDGGNTGSAALPGNSVVSAHVYGDSLALRGTDGGLRVLDLASGTLGPAVASDVRAVTELSGGRLAVAVPGGVNGRIVVLEDGVEPPPGVGLPAAGRPVKLGLSGDVVTVTAFVGTGASDDNDGEVLQLVDGTWRRPTDAPLISRSSNLLAPLQVAGDTLVTTQSLEGGDGLDVHRVSWPGGHRDIVAPDQSTRLGHGGQFLARIVAGEWRAEVARTGEPAGPARVIDGAIGYTSIDPLGRLPRTDLSGADPLPEIAVGVTCAPSPAHLEEVRGRWAHVTCGARHQVLDLDGVLAPRLLPPGYRDDLTVGDGFAIWSEWRDRDVPVVRVVDLVTGETRSYGPTVGGRSPFPQFAVDDAGGPTFVYNDPRDRLRKVTLDWLAPAPSVKGEATPPVLGAAAPLPATLAQSGATLTYAYSASDPAGVASYDVQVRRAAPWSDRYDDWDHFAVHTDATSVRVNVAPGEQVCLRFRARDRWANLSGWSSPQCLATAMDDRLLRRGGETSRKTSALAIAGTYTLLRERGARVTAEIGGRTAGVWVLVGPGLGRMDVLANGRVVRRVNLEAAMPARRFVRIDPGRRFTSLAFRQVGDRRVRVDAVVGYR